MPSAPVLETARRRTIAELAGDLEKQYPAFFFIPEKPRFWQDRDHCHGVRMVRFKAYWKLSGARKKEAYGYGCTYCGKTDTLGI